MTETEPVVRLASPGKIAHLTLKNRFILSPLHTMLADRLGQVTPEMLAYYQQRALGGAALVITEYAFIDDAASRANVAQLSIADDLCIPGLARLAETIRHAGARSGMQIAHAGRQRFLGTSPIVAPSRVPWPFLEQVGAPIPVELTCEQIAEIVDAYARAAQRVQQAGFDLVEVHAGHGYLIGQFLSPHTNRRTDLYGGDLSSRMRFLQEVIRAIRLAVGPTYPVTVRLSGSDYDVNGITVEDSIETARMLEAEGVASLDISAGNHHTMETQVQPMYFPPGTNADAAAAIKAHVRIPVSVVGSVNSPAIAREIVSSGKADFVRMGRPLLADPYFPLKVVEGREVDVRPCIRCNDCLDRAVGLKHPVRCSVNFSCGREADIVPPLLSREQHLAVTVIGGGPAGLEAARILARRGHHVTLFERDQLGGVLNAACALPFKRHDLRPYIKYLVGQIQDVVDIQRESASVAQLRQQSPDVVILASGARPQKISLAGIDTTRVVDMRAALGGAEVGARVVVNGGDQFAAEVAVFLATQGRQVTIVNGRDEVAADVGPHHRTPLLQYLLDQRVEVLDRAQLIAVEDSGCQVVTAPGSHVSIPCDTIITTQYEPDDDLIAQLVHGPWKLLQIGDCVAPRRIFDAIEDANLVARAL